MLRLQGWFQITLSWWVWLVKGVWIGKGKQEQNMFKPCFGRGHLILNYRRICLVQCGKCQCQLDFLCGFFLFFFSPLWPCTWTGTSISSVSIPQCVHTNICVQFVANQTGELIQLENNLSQKQKEVFCLYLTIKIPWCSSLHSSKNTCAGILLWATNSQRRKCFGSCGGSWGISNCNLERLSFIGRNVMVVTLFFST